jgi:hypothetical protein
MNSLKNVRSVLKVVDDAANYERTIQKYNEKIQMIRNMCVIPPVDWLAVMNAILDLILEEEDEKSERDANYIKTIERDLNQLEILRELTEAETASAQNKLAFDLDTHFLGDPFAAIADVRMGLEVIRNYKQSIQGITQKFKDLRNAIATTQWNLPGIVATAIHILTIIQEADSKKSEREKVLLGSIEKIAVSFRDATANIATLKGLHCELDHGHGSHDFHLNTQMRLDAFFSFAVDTFNTVIGGVNPVMEYQKTIETVSVKFTVISDQLRQLAAQQNVAGVIGVLLDIITTLQTEDGEKLKRDPMLKEKMDAMAVVMKDTMDKLYAMGFQIV